MIAKRGHCQGMNRERSSATIQALAKIIGSHWAAENFLVNMWTKIFYKPLGWRFLFTGQQHFYVIDKEGITFNDINEWDDFYKEPYDALMKELNKRAYTLDIAHAETPHPLIIFRRLWPIEYAAINLGHHFGIYGDWWDVTSKKYKEYAKAVGLELAEIDPELAFKVYGIRTPEQVALAKKMEKARDHYRVAMYELGRVLYHLEPIDPENVGLLKYLYEMRLEASRDFVLRCNGELDGLRELKDRIHDWRTRLARGETTFDYSYEELICNPMTKLPVGGFDVRNESKESPSE